MEKAGTLATMYHSVPPRPLSYTFSDVLQDSVSGDRGDGTRSRTAPVSTNAPEEYAERFKSRPTTRPAVIDFNGTTVNLYPKIGLPRPNAGFSPVKSKQGQGHRFQPRTSKSLPEVSTGLYCTNVRTSHIITRSYWLSRLHACDIMIWTSCKIRPKFK